MPNTYEKSKEKILALKGSRIDSFTVVASKLDCLEGKSVNFLYSLCCYFKVENEGVAYKLSSIESESGYTLYVSDIDNEEYLKRFEDLSSEMSVSELYAGLDLTITDLSPIVVDEDILAVELMLSSEESLYLVSGECFGTDNGYGLSVSDEMVLVFQSIDAIKKEGLSSDLQLWVE